VARATASMTATLARNGGAGLMIQKIGVSPPLKVTSHVTTLSSHRTGHADRPHPTLGQELTPSPRHEATISG
jgi:hypothetical protein